MIDCSKTKNYFAEKQRMAKQQKYGVCNINCSDCPLSVKNNDTGILCSNLESNYPEKAIAIMQKWSDEHPPKTYLSEFLKNYPNAPLNDDGIPKVICIQELGVTMTEECNNDCVKCWNQRKEGE